MTDLVKVKVQLPHGFDPNLGPRWTDLWLREGTSDEDVLNEIWVRDLYHLRGLDLRSYLADGRDDIGIIPVLDIGACTGLFSALVAQAFPQSRIVAVEPDRDNLDILTLNTLAWRTRIDIVPKAIGAYAGTTTMFGTHGQGYTIGDATTDDGGLPIMQDTLASMVNNRPCSLLKLDIEGGEYDAIAACPSDSLALVDRIVLEWHGTREAPHVEDAPRRYGELVTHLAYTHSCDGMYGTPDAGGYGWWHRNDL